MRGQSKLITRDESLWEYRGPCAGIKTMARARLSEYVLPAEGIRYEVIAADIKAYLGNEASVRVVRYKVGTVRA